MQNATGGDVGSLDGMRTPNELFATHIVDKTRDPDIQKKVNAAYRFDLSGWHRLGRRVD
jgi:hypothetical protein